MQSKKLRELSEWDMNSLSFDILIKCSCSIAWYCTLDFLNKNKQTTKKQL